MSGTSSRMSSSTSALGIRSYTYPDRDSSSNESPARSGWFSNGSASRTTRSSSAWEMTRARWESARTSLSMTTSPTVSYDWLARAQLTELYVRGYVHPHLAAAGEHVARVVLVRVQEDAEPGRRLSQPVHFLLQRDDLVACLTQGRRQPLVLGGNSGEIPLGLAQPVLKEPDLPGRIRQPTPQYGDLLVKEGDLSGKALHLILVTRVTPAFFSGGHGPHLLLHR